MQYVDAYRLVLKGSGAFGYRVDSRLVRELLRDSAWVKGLWVRGVYLVKGATINLK